MRGKIAFSLFLKQRALLCLNKHHLDPYVAANRKNPFWKKTDQNGFFLLTFFQTVQLYYKRLNF